MARKIATVLVALSIALNVAFVATWARHALASSTRTASGPNEGPIWCPLHRKLGVSEAQWKEIEPRMAELKTRSAALGRDMARERSELMDLIALPEVDREAVRRKQEDLIRGQRQLQELVIEQLLAEKKTLTAEQQKTLFELLRNRCGCAAHGVLGVPGRKPLGYAGESTDQGCPEIMKQRP